jgi:Xaa-Pro dipeptidase
MKRDEERARRNTQALKNSGLDAFVCALPANVLLLAGYWPVIATSIALAMHDGRITLLVPEDELALAREGWADTVFGYRTGSLEELKNIAEIVSIELRKTAPDLDGKKLGFESSVASVPVPYAAVTIFGWAIPDVLIGAFPSAKLIAAGDMLARLASTLTPGEIERVRTACRIAEEAYSHAAQNLKRGMTETDAAAAFRAPLSTAGNGVGRADGSMFCMSGENSYQASAAYQRSRSRRLRGGDLALVHCNSYVDGFWTDITRTYCLGEPDERQIEMYVAIFAALDASFDAIGTGVAAAEVDRAARDVLRERGFEKEFVHGLGHGVGFVAIDHGASPRLHPASPDRLKTGMVFNIEPAIYIKGYGGMRHCDMIAVTETGAELLTPFQRDIGSMILTE